MARGRELKKGNVLWCCCCGLCSGSALVIKHLAQPDGVLGMDAGKMSLVRTAAWGKSSRRSLQLQLGIGEVKVKTGLHLRQNFVYETSGALGQCWHKYPTLLGKHHVRDKVGHRSDVHPQRHQKAVQLGLRNHKGTGFPQLLIFSYCSLRLC